MMKIVPIQYVGQMQKPFNVLQDNEYQNCYSFANSCFTLKRVFPSTYILHFKFPYLTSSSSVTVALVFHFCSSVLTFEKHIDTFLFKSFQRLLYFSQYFPLPSYPLPNSERVLKCLTAVYCVYVEGFKSQLASTFFAGKGLH